jgi:hypothetical protein
MENREFQRSMKEIMDPERKEMKAMQEEIMAKLDAHHDRLMGLSRKDGGHRFGCNSRRNRVRYGAWKVPKEDAAVKPVGGLRKRQGIGI